MSARTDAETNTFTVRNIEQLLCGQDGALDLFKDMLVDELACRLTARDFSRVVGDIFRGLVEPGEPEERP